MQNEALHSSRDRPLAQRSVDRALEARRVAYAEEVRRFVEAGFALVRKSGQLELRVSEVVAAAGLSNHAFYKHFRSKDELLVTLLDDGIRQLSSYLRHRMETVSSPRERIRRWVEGMCEQAVNARAAAATRPFALGRGRLAERFPDEVAESERRISALVQRAIADAVEAGELPRADPARDAAVLYDLAMGWMQRKLAQPEPPSRDEAASLVVFALSGLERGRPARRPTGESASAQRDGGERSSLSRRPTRESASAQRGEAERSAGSPSASDQRARRPG
ncbi:MAG: TetR/AcrR family transcriptional regulator [Myxococcota bacterium]|nr:TetR/AcrR family transcriptional regulator [Myxococcota bacterium]